MKIFLLASLYCLTFSQLVAQSNDELQSVQVQATVDPTVPSITLDWDSAVVAVAPLTLYRRTIGETNWGAPLATLDSNIFHYTDLDVETEVSYEYRVVRPRTGGTGYGYLYSGIETAAPAQRGILIMVVEDSMALPLASELRRYRQDVSADGWLVKSLIVHAADADTTVKAAIQTLYDQAPTERHALFLLGHVPVPYAGNISPDGHNNHRGAWSADIFYADMDGNWTDQFIDNTTASRMANHNVPGDGKWDNSTIASDIELEVGRVDFNNLPLFAADATELTRRYLDKDHAFRRRVFAPLPRALIENNFAGFAEGFGQNGLKNFATLVGRDSTRYLDYNTLKTDSYLLSYGCGGGNYQGAGGIANTAAMAADSFQSVFTFLFGSYFGDWDSQNNFLRAALASGTTLTNAWAGRPNWTLHPMGMGHTIGYCAKLTQNNAGFSYSSGFGNRSVHVALMGDPTLRMYVVPPPSELMLTETLDGIQLDWTAASAADLVGYHLYRRSSETTHYERVGDEAIAGTSFFDFCPPTGDSLQYLVKTVRLEVSPSGSFYNESIGADAGIVSTIDRSVTAGFSLSVEGTAATFVNLSSNATTFSWDFGDGSASTDPDPVHEFAPGTYEVQLIAANGCSADTFSQFVMITPSSSRELTELGVRLYPNPATNGRIQLLADEVRSAVRYSISDQLGRVVQSGRFPRLVNETIQLADLPAGSYLFRLEMRGERGQTVLIVQSP